MILTRILNRPDRLTGNPTGPARTDRNALLKKAPGSLPVSHR
jgi:hypothetical protein